MRAPWLVVVLACGSVAAPASEPVAETPPAAESSARASYDTPVVTGAIDRTQLIPVLDAGLGRFLQGVDTEPDLREGAFIGFRLRRLYPADERFASLDLRPGDTIVRINGEIIERPEQALAVWESLRVASELMVVYLRDDEERELRFEIVD